MTSETRPLLGITADGGTPRRSIGKVVIAIVVGITIFAGAMIGIHKKKQNNEEATPPNTSTSDNSPNIIVFMVDDLGFNQVGYHANPKNNSEVITPNIDTYSKQGIRMNRGYMTPWCAPSRSAFQTGTMNSFNGELTNDVFAFDDDIGFIGGLQAGTVTLAKALKDYTKTENKKPYKASYAGKWGIGGTSWANTPMGLDYDSFQGFWGDSMDSCDGWVPVSSVPGIDGAMMRAFPGYWEQGADVANEHCDKFRDLENDGILNDDEANVACQSAPASLPEIMDDDILNYTLKILKEHDYTEGPLYHMHATQILHLPMQYPSKYDEDPESDLNYLTNENKPNPNNTILRLKTNNMLRYMDDIFGEIMQAINSTGQWDNTIVLFTTDNGGAIYSNSANNNYPLRGAKLSAFEGGTRVPQFLTGGWLNQQGLELGNEATSDTFVVVNDWAPTLLGMAGGNISYLLGDANGPAYGNYMWEHIKASVSSSGIKKKLESQKERFVTFSPQLFLDIRKEKTFKYIQTPDNTPIYFARKWDAIWPTDDDIIPDFGYKHVNPCRPNGDSMECCYFRIDTDEYEDTPLSTDCTEKRLFALKTYYSSPTCDIWPKQLCDPLSKPKVVPSEREQGNYTLWTIYNASGPFTTSSGYPITADQLFRSDSATNCMCTVDKTDEGDVNAFIPTPSSPTICINKDDSDYDRNKLYIPCDNFSGPAFDGSYDKALLSYEKEGFPLALTEAWFKADSTSSLDRLAHVPTLMNMFYDYVTREGFTEWPNMAKFPYVAAGQDSCSEKSVTANPIPTLALTLWFLRQGDVTSTAKATKNLCIGYGVDTYFCPAVDNVKQDKITSFNYSRKNPSFTILTETGEEVLVEARSRSACIDHCNANKTAYIGGGKWGITSE